MKEFLIVFVILFGLLWMTNRDFVHWFESNFNAPWLRDRPLSSDRERFLLGSLFILMGLFTLFLYLT